MGSSPLQSLEVIEKLRARPLVTAGRAKALPLGQPDIDAFLPDGGLPQGAVVELCSSAGLGQATAAALAACAAAQEQARKLALDGDGCAWCAWIDSSRTLYAPGVMQAGVEPERLLVVRPPAESVARVAVRLASSGLFSVLVIDRCGVPGAKLVDRRTRWSTAVRRLSLSVETSETTVVLLSTIEEARAQTLPVALRLELSHPEVDRTSLRISKERHGRLSGPRSFSPSLLAPRIALP
ncbi:MAG: recombinase A [Deltaproteobacteria bacterium]|jgi:recombination protein RecA|nr:recombinase A [Deltaproteobacteria bacterium]MBW2533736.1 recombinase A [Deltaproteobacteria bacterium]